MTDQADVLVIRDPAIAAYGFGEGHPFGPDRHDVFHTELVASGVADRVRFGSAREASLAELRAFHTPRYLQFVAEACQKDTGMTLDGG